MNIFIIINILFGILGVYITHRIRRNKKNYKQGQGMVCLVGHKCDVVIFSDYSKFFGINLEIMGFLYYLLISLFYIFYFVFPTLVGVEIIFLSLGLTFGGFLFSIYLTYIQIFKLKSLCFWCLGSALVSILIFVASYSLVLFSIPEVIEYIVHVQNYIRLFEFISLVAGVGIFTVLEITTLKFLKDFKITPKENEILKNISQVGWFVLFLSILNNVGIYLPELIFNSGNLTGPALRIFSIELILILSIVFNEIISEFQILPIIKRASLNIHNIEVTKVARYRHIAFAQSIASIILWYGLFYFNFMI
jgi:uncharacterized membrane protein